MLSDMMDLILYPVGELLKLLVDNRITSYLGVSVLGIAVTCACALIVVSALVNRVYTVNTSGTPKATKTASDIAIEEAKKGGHSLYK